MKKNNYNDNKNASDKSKRRKKVELDINDEYILSENDGYDKGIDIVKSHNEKLIEDRYKRLYKKNEDKSDRNNVRYKIRPVVIGIIVVIIVALVYSLFEYGPIFGINVSKNSNISKNSKIDIITSESDIYKMYNQELLVYSNNVVSTYNNYCQKTWSYDLVENFKPNIYINNEYMVIANNANGTIYMFENKREIFNKKIEGSIQDIYIDDLGNIAVEYSTTGYKKIIGVYDKNGKSKFDTYLDSSTLIDVKIIDNCKKLLIAQANSNSFKMGVGFSIVDSTKETDSIVKLCEFENSLLYDIDVQGQSAIVILDKKISKIDLNNGNVSDIKSFENNQLLFTSINNDYYICLEKELDNSENGYIISTSQYNGTNISKTNISNLPKYLYSDGLLNYFVYQNSIQVINKWGIEVKNIPIESIPSDLVIFNNGKSVGLIYTNKIYIVSI